MKIVVIGGTGLIGSKLIANVTAQRHDAVAAARGTGAAGAADLTAWHDRALAGPSFVTRRDPRERTVFAAYLIVVTITIIAGVTWLGVAAAVGLVCFSSREP